MPVNAVRLAPRASKTLMWVGGGCVLAGFGLWADFFFDPPADIMDALAAGPRAFLVAGAGSGIFLLGVGLHAFQSFAENFGERIDHMGDLPDGFSV